LNHYLAPLVEQLIELWRGIDLSETFESSNGKKSEVRLYAVLVTYLPQESFVDISLRELHATDALNMPVLTKEIN
jgi:hypothetical protein